MDQEYWENYYSKQREPSQPSLFAEHVMENYDCNEKSTFIELGCGNGRDSIFFHEKGVKVLAIDQAEKEINFLQNRFKGFDRIEFESGDFTKLEHERTFDIVYSRFTLHSITAPQQTEVINWAHKQLNQGGLFCIEVRGKKNELYKKGEQVTKEKDAYIYEGHYRRFLDFGILCEELKSLGFSIEYSKEEKGFSPFNQTNETFIRLISKK